MFDPEHEAKLDLCLLRRVDTRQTRVVMWVTCLVPVVDRARGRDQSLSLIRFVENLRASLALRTYRRSFIYCGENSSILW